MGGLGLALGLWLLGSSTAVEVERVLALVNGVPILASDVELAQIAGIVPKMPHEDEASYRKAVLEALIALELRYQDLVEARLEQRVSYDWQAAWQRVVTQAGGEEELNRKLAEQGFSQGELVRLVQRAALVEAYVAKWFAPSLRVTQGELEAYYRQEFLRRWPPGQGPPPPLEQVRPQLEALVKEKKLLEQVQTWTEELARRGEVIRYSR